MTEADRFRGCLLGVAVGDALGTALEFQPRGSFEPIIDMVGGGPFNLSPGQWTDDTSMALCLATSLIERGGFDPQDQIEQYCRWRDEGYLSSTGRCFDIGATVASALRRYRATGHPYAGSTDSATAGNGCIMRLAPIPMFFFPDEGAAKQYSRESSRTTHGAAECIDACGLFGGMICRALGGQPKDAVLFGDVETFEGSPRIAAIARGEYRDKSEGDIHGTGYVVACLEAAAWCFAQTDTFEAALLRAANLGDDADTTAAVCGQLAGAFYGESAIPQGWLAKLAMRREISLLADGLRRRHAERSNTAMEPSAPVRS